MHSMTRRRRSVGRCPVSETIELPLAVVSGAPLVVPRTFTRDEFEEALYLLGVRQEPPRVSELPEDEERPWRG
jgi:hypothetical protein